MSSSRSTKKKRSSSSSSGVLDYLQKSLPKSTLLQLYADETRGRYVCRAVLQQLLPVTQQVVLRLCCCGGTFAKSSVLVWTKQKDSFLDDLKKWSIAGQQEDKITLTPEFHAGLKQMLESSDSSPWTPLTQTQLLEIQQEDPKLKLPSLDDLDRHTRQQWSTVLHFLVGTPTEDEPPPAVVQFLLQTGLMQTDPEYNGSPDDAPLVITRKGYDFMLQEGPQQVWHFCQQYLARLEGHKKRKELLKEALLFLICLSFGRVGDAYPSSALTKDARILMKDLALFGLLYVQKVGKGHVFYPTRVAMQLLQGDDDASTLAARSNTRRQKALENDLKNPTDDSSHLAIIVQTNFQLCAYTVSQLHVSMLGLFCDVQTIRRLPNMVFMVLTRDSVKAAFQLGIQAKQILTFLEKHAHPNLKGDEVIPQNVVDQIWLWDRERHRVRWSEVYTHTCLLENEFDAVKQYAMDIGAHAWSNEKRRNEIMIKYNYAERVLEFVRRWRAKASAERED